MYAKKVYQVFVIIVHTTLARISSSGSEANDNVHVFFSISHTSWLLPSLDILLVLKYVWCLPQPSFPPQLPVMQLACLYLESVHYADAQKFAVCPV